MMWDISEFPYVNSMHGINKQAIITNVFFFQDSSWVWNIIETLSISSLIWNEGGSWWCKYLLISAVLLMVTAALGITPERKRFRIQMISQGDQLKVEEILKKKKNW